MEGQRAEVRDHRCAAGCRQSKKGRRGGEKREISECEAEGGQERVGRSQLWGAVLSLPLGGWSFLRRTGLRVLLCSTLKLRESVALSGRGLPPYVASTLFTPSHPIFSSPVTPGQERLGGGSGQEPQG